MSARSLSRIATLPFVIVLCVYVARAAEPVVTSQDIAVTELYTDLASHGRLLLGPYSRFGWHHPGPLYFYVQATLYAASNRAGASLFVGAIATNVIAFSILLWTILRQGRPVLATAVGIACIAVAWRAPRFLASPWTPHVTILPMLACLALAGAVASGRTRLLALTALFASFVVQTDLAFAPSIAIVVLLAFAAVLRRALRENAPAARDMALALCVSLAVWSLPLVDAAAHRGGNLAALLRFFGQTDVQPHSSREALGAWSSSLVGLVRKDLALAWGAPFQSQTTAGTIAAACALIAALTLAAYRAARMRRVFDAWFATMVLGTALSSLWALTRVRDEYTDYEVFWLVALGAVAAAIIVSVGAEPLSMIAPAVERWGRRAPPVLIVAAVALASLDLTSLLERERRWAGQTDVPLAVAAIESYLDREHSRSATVDVDAAWSQGVPIVLRLRQHHRRVTVSPGSLFIFTDAFAPTRKEDTSVRVQPGVGSAPEAGWQQIFDSYWASVYAR